jgi:hypothetical protein
VRGCEPGRESVAACAKGANATAIPRVKLLASDTLIDMSLSSDCDLAHGGIAPWASPNPMRVANLGTLGHEHMLLPMAPGMCVARTVRNVTYA